MKKTIPYGRQFIDDDDINAVIETLKSDYMTQGPKIKEFEDCVAEYHGAKYGVAFSNGTAALHASYYAAGLEKGDEFITTPITFVATANAGLYLGGIPKFVDIDKKNYNIDISKIEDAITDKTKVIAAVSYAGYPMDMKAVRDIAKRHGVVVVHDAAHAVGAIRDGKSIVKYADMTILSFHPVKHIATGEGGMVLTDNEDYYKKLKLFRTHGITKDKDDLIENHGGWYYEMQDLGYNYRMTDIQAALGITQMKKLDKSIYKRNLIARRYEEELKDLDWLELPLNYFTKEWLDESKYENLKNRPKNLNSYHLFPVMVKDRKRRKDFFDYMRENGIWVQVHYIPVHLMPYYRDGFGYEIGDFPKAEDFYSGELSIPMFPSLKDEEIDYVIEKIKDFK